MSAPHRGGRGYGRGGGGYGRGGYQHEYDPAGYGYDNGGYGYEDSYGSGGYGGGAYDTFGHGGGDYDTFGGGGGYGAPPEGRRGGPKGRGLGYVEGEKAPEEPTPPPPIVDGYAMPGMDAMPSTGIDTEKGSYKCYVCNIWTNTEVILNTHLGGKTHIKKLEQAGMNSFLPPEPLGPIPTVQALKEEKWKTGEKRKFSEIDPTNKGHFTCEVCNLEFNSRVVFETHMQGKKHARMLRSINEIKHQNVEVSCTVCNFVATSAVHLDAHLQGKNHKKRVEAAGKGVPGGMPSGFPARPNGAAAAAAAADGAPKMLSQFHNKKLKMEGGPKNPHAPAAYAEAATEEEYGEEEYYDESWYGYEGGDHGTGSAGYYGY